MHFTRVRIQNFQNVVLFDEELHPGLNVFTGRSRAGKSARSIRPFRWLWTNRPLGDKAKAWIRKGTDFMSVEAWTSDGYYIQHYLSHKDHYYKLQKPNQDKLSTFRAFGQHPPEEILQALNLKDINFQDQHSPHYLLSMNSSEVARELNDIANLSEIDDAFTAINARLRKDRAAETSAKALKEDLEQKQKQYEGLEELESNTRLLETLELQRNIKLKEAKQLHTLAWTCREKEESLLQYQDVENLQGHMTAFGQAKLDWQDLLSEAKRLKEVAARYKHHLQELVKYEDLPAAIRAWNRANNSWANKKQRIAALKEEADRLSYTANRHVELFHKAEASKVTAEKYEAEFHSVFPAKCPLCGKDQ